MTICLESFNCRVFHAIAIQTIFPLTIRNIVVRLFDIHLLTEPNSAV